MTIFEIDSRIKEILNPQIDPETGEILGEIDISELEKLQMDRQTKVVNCLLAYKNMSAEADAIEAEAKKLVERAKKIRSRANGAYNYADYCLNGDEVNDPRVSAKYSTSQTTEVSLDFIEWARVARPDLIRQKPMPDPEPNKVEITKALKNAAEDDELRKYAWREPHRKLKVS